MIECWIERIRITSKYLFPVLILPLFIIYGVEFIIDVMTAISAIIQIMVISIIGINAVSFVAAFYFSISKQNQWIFDSKCSTLVPTIDWAKDLSNWISE